MLFDTGCNFIKGKFFNKTFLIYSMIIIVATTSVSYLSILNLRTTLQDESVKYYREILRNINAYYQQQQNLAGNLIRQVYFNQAIHCELLYLLEHDYPSFIAYKLKLFCAGSAASWTGFEAYFHSYLVKDPDIVRISIFNANDNQVYSYSNSSRIIYPKDPEFTKLLEQSPIQENDWIIVPAHNLSYSNEKVYTFAFPIRAIFAPRIIGTLTVDYSINGLRTICRKYITKGPGNILILTKRGRVIFDSSDTYWGRNYPDWNQLVNRYSLRSNRNVYITAESEGLATITAAVIPVGHFNRPAQQSGQIIILLSCACIIGTIIATHLVTKKMARRVTIVTNHMKQICNGDLSVTIPVDPREPCDEIGEIANSFNQMCAELNNYIKKVYLAEIKQQRAQLYAFQAQIKPHFLYNTLEAIRMRAISQGCSDVGQMIYLTAALLRSSIKAKTVITIREELHFSQIYFDLYNLRYQGRLSLEFQIEEPLLNYGIIKHVFQPIIENYLVHGVDGNKDDNGLTIKAVRNGQAIIFAFSDNGVGMSNDRLTNIQNLLKGSANNPGSGLGLANVNARIRLIYGPEYGLTILSKTNVGTTVNLTVPILSCEELTAYVPDSVS